MNSAGSGNWSAGATWVGGVAPTATDTAVILSTHTVTLDNTSCVALSVTVNSGGTLTCSTIASSTLTVQNNIDALAGSTVNLDVSSVPSVVCTIKINNANTTADSTSRFYYDSTVSINIKGAPRTRKTTLTAGISTGATSAVVTTATNWAVGDVVVFASTGAYNATPLTDVVTLTSVSGGSIGWTGGTTNAHAIGGYVGNFSSNMSIGPATPGTFGHCVFGRQYGTTFNPKVFDNVKFQGAATNVFPVYSAFFVGGLGFGSSATSNINLTISNSAFYDCRGAAIGYDNLTQPIINIGNVFYSAALTVPNCSAIFLQNNCKEVGVIDDIGVFRYTGGSNSANGIHILSSAGATIKNSFVSGCRNSGLDLTGTAMTLADVETFANQVGITYQVGNFDLLRVNNGTFNSGVCTNSTDVANVLLANVVATDCKDQTSGTINSGLSTTINAHSLAYVNKDVDVTKQEIYRPFMSIKRANSTDDSVQHRSTSSVAITPTKISTACTRTVSIPCANGASVRIVGYVKKSHASNIAATVALTGLGSAWGGFTAAANTSWQVWDTGSVTNSSGVDGNFTLTYTANSSSGTTNVVYFDGVPDSPFVTKCRHYGFTFDEANPVRTVNPVSLVSELTAIGYTGVTVTASQITVGAGTTDTWLKLYAYMQAYACANLTSTVNLTSTDGLTFSLPLTYKLSWPAMGSDGTLAGGWLLLAATGTHTYKLSGTKIEFQTAGSYTMSASTFSGTVELVNTSGGAVTVFLPSGTSYTNTGPSITVSTPIVQQSVTITGVTAGSRVQIYDTTNSVELFNGTSGYSWTDGSAAVATRDIRVRVAYVSGATAKTFIEANIGTCGTTAPSNAISYLVSQINDTTYNSNTVDGSTVTGITFTDAATDLVNCNIAGGSVAWKDIYAAFVYWNFTATGIANDFTYVAAPDTANYLLSGMKIRNTSAVDLSIISGYGRDATTGLSKDIIDTAGSTGNIFLAPDHVVPYQTTGSYAITGDISTVLTAVGNVPTGVRTELTTELARIDVATSTRLATAGYTAPTTPPTAAAISAQVLADAATTPIKAEIKAINGVTLAGSGTTLDPMRPA